MVVALVFFGVYVAVLDSISTPLLAGISSLGAKRMAKKWYVLHTYSGYENKVKKNLETRIETMGLENNVFGIEIPTEMVTEIKEGAVASRARRRCSRATCSSAWSWTIAAGLRCATRRA